MTDRRIKIVALSGSFFIVSLILMVLVSKLLAYYKSGSDATLSSSYSVQKFYAKTNWNTDQVIGRVMEKETLEKITQDYLAGLRYLQQHYQDQVYLEYHDYFTNQAKNVIVEHAELQKNNVLKTLSSSYEHHLDLKLYHLSGSQVVFQDTRLSFDEIYYKDESLGQQYDTANYQVMMLLEDDKWRIRHQKKVSDSSRLPGQEHLPKAGMIRVAGNEFFLGNNKFPSNGINYYPADYPWNLFWTSLDAELLENDLQEVKKLGLSVVRVFVPFHEFGGAEVSEAYIIRLQDLLNLAQKHQIRVVITLFDFFLSYQPQHWPESDRHLESLMTRLKDHPAIFAWDIKNEPDLDFAIHGEQQVMNWLEFAVRRARLYDPNHLITIGWSDIEHTFKLWEFVDFTSVHFYRDPDILDTFLNEHPPVEKPFVLGEIGMHTFKSWWYPIGNNQQEQKIYYKRITDLADRHKINYWAWTLYDFNQVPKQVAGKYAWQRKPQSRYGLFDGKGNPKEAYHIIKNHNQTHKDNE